MRNWLYGIAAGLIVVGFAILGRDGRRAKAAEADRDSMILDGSRGAQAKAERAGKKADKLQANAKLAEEVGRAVVDKVGTQHETIGSVLDSWRQPDGV